MARERNDWRRPLVQFDGKELMQDLVEKRTQKTTQSEHENGTSCQLTTCVQNAENREEKAVVKGTTDMSFVFLKMRATLGPLARKRGQWRR